MWNWLVHFLRSLMRLKRSKVDHSAYHRTNLHRRR